MSWNKNIFSKIYKRALKHVCFISWSTDDMYDEDNYREWKWSQEDQFWYDYNNPKSMKELGQLRLAILLRSLDIKEAAKLIDDRGWERL